MGIRYKPLIRCSSKSCFCRRNSRVAVTYRLRNGRWRSIPSDPDFPLSTFHRFFFFAFVAVRLCFFYFFVKLFYRRDEEDNVLFAVIFFLPVRWCMVCIMTMCHLDSRPFEKERWVRLITFCLIRI